jgi:hypothetical protein
MYSKQFCRVRTYMQFMYIKFQLQASAEREVFHFCLFMCAEIAARLGAEKLLLVCL